MAGLSVYFSAWSDYSACLLRLRPGMAGYQLVYHQCFFRVLVA